MKTAVFLICAIVVGAVMADLAADQRAFLAFKTQFNRAYATGEEDAMRFAIFQNNLRIAAELDAADPKAEFGITRFMDLTQDEFRAQFLLRSHNATANHHLAEVEPVAQANPPASFDWRSKGAVTPVYDQQQCGSCWAFSTTEAVESAWFLSGKPLTKLSMQQLVSCDHYSYGCNGGFTTTAYDYIKQAGGLEGYSAYPYTSGAGNSGYCKFNAKDIVAKISSWAYVSRADSKTPRGDENAMMAGSYQYGPLSICVDATTWQYYRGGIITANCGRNIDHCVQQVGWGTDGTTPYWLIRNSWNTNWGEQGYLRVERNKDLCAVADEVTRPII